MFDTRTDIGEDIKLQVLSTLLCWAAGWGCCPALDEMCVLQRVQKWNRPEEYSGGQSETIENITDAHGASPKDT